MPKHDLGIGPPENISWRDWLGIKAAHAKHSARHPRLAFKRRWRLPLRGPAFRLAVRVHLGRVDVYELRQAFMRLDSESLTQYGCFGPIPGGLREYELSLYSIWMDEAYMRTGRPAATSDDPELVSELFANRPADAVYDPDYLPICSRDLWSP